MWKLGDEKEDDDTDEHSGGVIALACLGLGRRAFDRCRRLADAAVLPTSQQPLAALTLTPNGEHQQEAEQRHEHARQQFDDERVDPEVDCAQRGVDGRRVRLAGRRHYLIHRPIGRRVRAAGDRQRQVVGNQDDDARRADQEDDPATCAQVLLSVIYIDT